MEILKTLLAPYYFLTSPASYAEANEPEIEDPRVAECVRQAQWQLLHADLPLIEVGAETYDYLATVLEQGAGPLSVLGVPIRPLDWESRVEHPSHLWTTGKGSVIHVAFMANTHLIHTEAYLARTGNKQTPAYGMIKGELNKRVRRGLNASPIQPYECVEIIDPDELGDNRKTMGYRKARFGTARQRPIFPMIPDDCSYGDISDDWFDDLS